MAWSPPSTSGFSLETQTRPVYGFYVPEGSTPLLVHELAHQWFGDSVSVERWRDIWLNEGFASFMSWMYDEDHGGWSGQKHLEMSYGTYAGGSEFWRLEIGDPGPDDIFLNPVYERGAMTLQALRNRIGDDAFWTVMRTWVADHRHGNASTADFIALAEDDQRPGPRRLLRGLVGDPGAAGRDRGQRSVSQPSVEVRATSSGSSTTCSCSVVGVVGLVEHQLGGATTELVAGLADRRERDGSGAGEVDVVVTDDRQVVGYGESGRHELLEQAEGQQVVGAERGGGALARAAARGSARRPSGPRARSWPRSR